MLNRRWILKEPIEKKSLLYRGDDRGQYIVG